MSELDYGAALLLGFLGGSHCLVMCGGIGSALGMGVEHSRRYLVLILFQVGRVASYTLLGAALGAGVGVSVGALAGEPAFALPVLRILSGVLLICMGFYLGNWWNGLLLLENLGQHLWRRVRPLTQSLLPVRRWHDAVLVGLCWGFLPCGLIYTALAWSASAGSAPGSALLMFCFGMGTVPLMFATGVAGERMSGVLRHQGFRRGAALALITFGLWTVLTIPGAGHTGHAMKASPGTAITTPNTGIVKET